MEGVCYGGCLLGGGGGVCSGRVPAAEGGVPALGCVSVPGGPAVVGGGVCFEGVSVPGGVCSWRVFAPGVNPPIPLRDGHCCGRYASYWNAFLFLC